MSKLRLPPKHREILRKTLLHSLQQPPAHASVNELPGSYPSLRLGEGLIRIYKTRLRTEQTPSDHSPTSAAHTGASSIAPQQHAPTTPLPPHRQANRGDQPSRNPTEAGPSTSQTPHTALHQRIATCQKCRLHQTRENTVVFPQKSKTAQIMVLLDIVNWGDQLAGRFFTTADGKLLLKILAALNLSVNDVYVSAAIKCASAEEISNQLPTFAVCLHHLREEIALLEPRWILAFGEDTYKLLTEKETFQESLTKQSAKTPYRFENVPLTYTHHPRELLRDPSLKKETWDHLKEFAAQLKLK